MHLIQLVLADTFEWHTSLHTLSSPILTTLPATADTVTGSSGGIQTFACVLDLPACMQAERCALLPGSEQYEWFFVAPCNAVLRWATPAISRAAEVGKEQSHGESSQGPVAAAPTSPPPKLVRVVVKLRAQLHLPYVDFDGQCTG